MMNKKADTGIGTLILFIAMILVAAIAAGVLIQTATSLQNKALLTGDRTKGQVSTSLSVLLIYAEDGSVGNYVNNFSLKLKLSPGSDPIKLNDTLIEVDLSDSSSDLTYDPLNTCPATTTGNFSVNYLVQGADYTEHYLHRGDIIMLCFQAPRAVLADEDIAIRVIPKVGTPTVIETATPEVINQKRAYIFP
ncbi:MAG: archaellin/type IV pilin N-terminal domain-containing protein [Candidatus Woesearchaeota archaeon]